MSIERCRVYFYGFCAKYWSILYCTWHETIEFRKELLDIFDDLAADGQQFTAERIEEMHGNDDEDDGKIHEGNYTKVDVTIYALEICDQRKD